MKEKTFIIEYEPKERRVQGVVELILGAGLICFIFKYVYGFVEFIELGSYVISQTTPFYVVVFAVIGWLIVCIVPIAMIMEGFKHLHQIDKLEYEGIKPTDKQYLSAIKILSIKERSDIKQKQNKPFKEKVIYKEK